MPDSTATRYYTVAEAADILRCTPKAVWILCREHKIPASMPAGKWLIPVKEFDEWVAASGNQATA